VAGGVASISVFRFFKPFTPFARRQLKAHAVVPAVRTGYGKAPMNKSPIDAPALGLNPASHRERDLFAWLIASFLLGKRIQQSIALAAYRGIVETHRIDSLYKLSGCSHRQLVTLLGQARYVRYDESTATRLLALGKLFEADYDGQVAELMKRSADRQDCARRLQAFDGIGPKTAEIFLRAAWPA
jgi:endonuclease III